MQVLLRLIQDLEEFTGGVSLWLWGSRGGSGSHVFSARGRFCTLLLWTPSIFLHCNSKLPPFTSVVSLETEMIRSLRLSRIK